MKGSFVHQISSDYCIQRFFVVFTIKQFRVFILNLLYAKRKQELKSRTS